MATFPTTSGTHTIVTGVEYSIAQAADYTPTAPRTTAGYVAAAIDLSALVAGDSVEVRVYRSIAGGPPLLVDVATLPPMPVYVIPLTLVGGPWDITVKLVSAAPRPIGFEIAHDTNEVAVGSIANGAITAAAVGAEAVTKLQAGVATATAVAAVQADATQLRADMTGIQSRLPAALDSDGRIKAGVQSMTVAALDAITAAIFGFVVEAGAPEKARTFVERLRIAWSVLAGPASGLAIAEAGTEHMRDAADTKDRAVFQLAPNGTRTPIAFDGD